MPSWFCTIDHAAGDRMTLLFNFCHGRRIPISGLPFTWSGTDERDCSHCYTLWRVWVGSKPFLQMIGPKPSTANEDTRDRTVTRISKWGRTVSFGAFCMTNLSAFRSPRPGVIRVAADPIRPDKNCQLDTISLSGGLMIAARGKGGGFLGRSPLRRQKKRKGRGYRSLSVLV